MQSNDEFWLLRHGETEWSLSGQHTGWSDIPLTSVGEAQARALGVALAGRQFAAVWVSPLQRAVRTCALAGYGGQAIQMDDLREWNYGRLEGHTTADMRKEIPDWTIWKDGAPGGESIDEVYTRAGRILEQAAVIDGDVAIFAHGHILRLITAHYLGLPAADARLFALSTATISVLGWEHGTHVIRRWNQPTA